jgi:hypothetical protein
VSAVTTTEQARAERAAELASTREELQRQRQERQDLESRGGGWGEERQMASAEVDALRHTLQELDAERDDQQRLADVRAEEIEEIKRDFVTLQATLLTSRQEADKFRSALNGGTNQLEDYQRSRASEEQLAQALSQAMAVVREEAREKSAEATGIMDDIMYMTKENQKLHEETRVLEQRIVQLASNAREQAGKQELASKRVRAIELERDDIAALYEKVSSHTREEALLVERLRSRTEATAELAAQLGDQLSQAVRREEESEVRAAQFRLDTSVLESQLQDIEVRLAEEEQMHQVVLMDGARLESDMAAAAAAQEGAGRREVVHAHAASALGLRLQQMHGAIAQARADVVQKKRSVAESREQTRRLEGLLEDERLRGRLCTAENESLRQCLDFNKGSLVPGAATVPITDTEAAANQLRQEVEKRYAEVAAYDAEQQAMLAEKERLRILLRNRQQQQQRQEQ